MKFLILLSLAVTSAFSLVACAGSDQSVRMAQDYVKQSAGYQKTGAAVMLQDSQVNLEVAGAQYAVDVGILSGYSSGVVMLTVTSSEGLYIVDGDVNPSKSLVPGLISFPYTLIASKSGHYYLYLHAEVIRDGVSSYRALTFIVQVGKEAEGGDISKKNGRAVNGVISMPAKEEIIR
jgi:Mg2+/citrate symporter